MTYCQFVSEPQTRPAETLVTDHYLHLYYPLAAGTAYLPGWTSKILVESIVFDELTSFGGRVGLS